MSASPATLSADDVRILPEKLARVFEENKDHLNDLDTKLGDGDHGRSMNLGFSAVAAYAKDNPSGTISSLLMEGGMQFNEAAGSTIGILMFSAMREAGKAVADKDQIGLGELKDMLEGAIKGIMKRGKAEVGQKTILDSLHPAFEALEKGLSAGGAELDAGAAAGSAAGAGEQGADEAVLIKAVIQAAADGAEKTRTLTPTIGRARWFAERSEGEIDPGAVSGALIIKTVGDYLLEKLK